MEVQRQPRPIGSTFLSIEANKVNTEEAKDKLLKHIILHYTTSGFTFNGVPCSIPQLSQLILTDQNKIMEHITNTAQNLGNFLEPEQLESTIKTMVTLGSTWAIQDRGLIMQQLATMQKAQGGTYKPFISGEVNKALKLLLDSNKNIFDMYKTFFTNQSNTTNIFNILGKDKEDEELQGYVTPQQALDIVIDNTQNKELQEYKLGRDPARPSELTDTDIEKLYQEHAVGETPDCFEGRTGTEALRGLEATDGPKAGESSIEGPKAKKPRKKVNSHQNPDIRRGEDYVDFDELPSDSEA